MVGRGPEQHQGASCCLSAAILPSALSQAAGHPLGFHYEAAFTPLVLEP